MNGFKNCICRNESESILLFGIAPKMQISVSQKIAQISAGVTRFVSHLRFEIFNFFVFQMQSKGFR